MAVVMMDDLQYHLYTGMKNGVDNGVECVTRPAPINCLTTGRITAQPSSSRLCNPNLCLA